MSNIAPFGQKVRRNKQIQDDENLYQPFCHISKGVIYILASPE